MNKLIGGAVLLFLVGGMGSGAQAGPWCAFYDASTYNCGFHSFQQCLATAPADGVGRIFSSPPAALGGRPAGGRQRRATDVSPFVVAVRRSSPRTRIRERFHAQRGDCHA
jgi:hypothetical protein